MIGYWRATPLLSSRPERSGVERPAFPTASSKHREDARPHEHCEAIRWKQWALAH